MNRALKTLPYLICACFFVAYSTLSIVRHNNYQSFGYDLGINDQAVWRYSTFQSPIITISPFPDKVKFYTHIELIYPFISPFYWIWSTRHMLLILETGFICSAGIAVYLLAKKKELKEEVSLSLLIGFLGFYGVQNAIYFDVHSATFGAALTMWFIYFAEARKKFLSILFFFLAITSKENIALFVFLVSVVLFFRHRTKLLIFFSIASLVYLFFTFFIFFPVILHIKYLYANGGGLLSNLNPMSLIDTDEKRQVFFYSLFSFGFLSLLNPMYLLPALGNLASFFMIGSDLPGAQGLSMHYRVSLAPLMTWATIAAITYHHKKLNNRYIAFYLVICTILVQLMLHLPLSYLVKGWFWQQPSGVKNIQEIIKNDLPKTASVVAQNNIIPHISHRDKIYELYPEKKDFTKNSPCGKITCNWFRWFDNPEFLLVDTSPEWDTRHLLTNHGEFVDGIKNLEKEHIITVYKQVDSATLYKVNKNPEDVF